MVDAGAGPAGEAGPPPPVDLPPYGEGGDDDDVSTSGLHPDHPLLARAQAALNSQLASAKQRLAEEIREHAESLRVRRGEADRRAGSGGAVAVDGARRGPLLRSL